MVVRVRVSIKGRKISKKPQTRSLIKKLKQLPSEILVQIASKLPVTKILQCSQPYLSHKKHGFDNIISDPLFPNFFQSHNNSKNSSKSTTFLAYDDVANSCTLIDYSPDHLISEFHFDRLDFVQDKNRIRWSNFYIVDSCNGWLLFYSLMCDGNWITRRCLDRLSASLRQVNPITRRCLVLPTAPYASASQDLHHGLGYGSKTGLLKVVRLYHREDSTKIMAGVMTSRDEGDGAWEDKDMGWYVGSSWTSWVQSKPVALNGALHWLVYMDSKIVSILRFDIDQEKIDFINPPCFSSTKSLNKRKRKKVIVSHSHLGVLDGLLCVGVTYRSTMNNTYVEIWVMKEYGIEKSWTLFTVIDGLDINKGMFVLTPEIKDGKLIILTKLYTNNPNLDFQKFFVDIYDPKQRKWDKRVPLLEGIDKKSRARMTVDHYLPSFL